MCLFVVVKPIRLNNNWSVLFCPVKVSDGTSLASRKALKTMEYLSSLLGVADYKSQLCYDSMDLRDAVE